MDEKLLSGTLKELAKAYVALRLTEEVKVNGNATWLKNALFWCEEHAIRLGRSGGTKHFYIERGGIDKVDSKLRSMGYSPLSQLIEGLKGDRIHSARYSPNEKDANTSPMEYLVLSACTELSMRLSYQSLLQLDDLPAQIQLELDIRELDLSQFDYLVVIENRDCFSAWHQYLLPEELTRLLVIYRGHEKEHSKACQWLKARWNKEKGPNNQIFFGDFDPHGLAIAIDSSTPYQYLLLPSVDWLQANYVTAHFDDNNAYLTRHLLGRCPERWQSLITMMYDKQIAVRQQWMFGMPLQLY